MRIILGLGNPGPMYAMTRHNAGVMLVDLMAGRLVSSYGWRRHFGALIFKSQNLWLVKSGTVFMNESGKLLQGLGKGELWVAHDDLDIRLGEYKIQDGVGPKDHGGVNSVEAVVGKGFRRIRIGIENRGEGGRVVPGEQYVLDKFTIEEKTILSGVLEAIANEVLKTNS